MEDQKSVFIVMVYCKVLRHSEIYAVADSEKGSQGLSNRARIKYEDVWVVKMPVLSL